MKSGEESAEATVANQAEEEEESAAMPEGESSTLPDTNFEDVQRTADQLAQTRTQAVLTAQQSLATQLNASQHAIVNLATQLANILNVTEQLGNSSIAPGRGAQGQVVGQHQAGTMSVIVQYPTEKTPETSAQKHMREEDERQEQLKEIVNEHGNDPVAIEKADLTLLRVPVAYLKPVDYFAPGWGDQVLQRITNILAKDPASVTAQNFQKYLDVSEDDLQKRLQESLATMESRRAFFFEDAQQTKRELEAKGRILESRLIGRQSATEVDAESKQNLATARQMAQQENSQLNRELYDNNVI